MADEEQLRILKKEGVEAWNQWRKNNPDIVPDLTKAYLGWADLGWADLSGADLREADLGEADLSGADLREADLSGADLILADLSGADLRNTTIDEGTQLDRKWRLVQEIVTQGARNLDLREADLSGAHLSGLDLSGLDLSGAHLREAHLSGANLEGTNLSRVMGLGTMFKGATLTGACIEDWNINSETNLENVICDYIYLKEGQQERRPASGNFEPGEFAKLVEKTIETVDLIFQNGIDWKAFLLSFQDLRVEYGEENLSIQAIEKKSGGAFVIRLSVPPDIDKGKIHQNFTHNYELALQAVEEKYKAVLAAKEEQIEDKDKQIQHYLQRDRQQSADMMEITKLLASRPINMETKAVVEQPRFDNRGASFGGGQAGRDYSGDVTHNYAQQGNLAEAAAEIQRLLEQLSQTYPTSTTTEQMVVAARAIEQIESNPDWKQRAVTAFQQGSLKALETHPMGAFILGAIKGWMTPNT